MQNAIRKVCLEEDSSNSVGMGMPLGTVHGYSLLGINFSRRLMTVTYLTGENIVNTQDSPQLRCSINHQGLWLCSFQRIHCDASIPEIGYL